MLPLRTRKGILQRAAVWLAQHVPYSAKNDQNCEVGTQFVEPCSSDEIDKPGNCPRYTYSGVCCGGVSAWTGVTEVQGHFENREQVHCPDMLPGDFLALHAESGGVAHWQMFRSWISPEDEREKGAIMKIWQMGGGSGATNMHIEGTHKSGPTPWCPFNGPMKSCYTCFRHPHLPEEDKNGVVSVQHLLNKNLEKIFHFRQI